MKKAAIITITQQENFGNRLQNYALQQFLRKFGIDCYTLHNHDKKALDLKSKILFFVKNNLKKIIYIKKELRKRKFAKFDKKYINFSDIHIYNNCIPQNIEENFDYFICGSDQIWNLNYDSNAKINFLEFVEEKPTISFAASFGSENIPESKKDITKKRIEKIKYLSVREESGKKMIESICNRKDTKVLSDPTLLLSDEEWNKISIMPKSLKTDEKYILCYFLGDIKEEYFKEIKNISLQNNWKIINILDGKNYTKLGPSEFLYLEKHAQLICTDSFHACVFSIIFKRPFIVFDRVQKGLISMSSRIDTLLKVYNLEERRYNGTISNEMLKINYDDVNNRLNNEKNKAKEFVDKIIMEEK